MSTAELQDRISNDAQGALRELQERISASAIADWEDALQLISYTIRDHPENGLTLFAADTGRPPGVTGAVIRGWGAAAPVGAIADAIVASLNKTSMSAHCAEIADLLGGASSPNGSAEWHRIAAARALALRVWVAAADANRNVDATDWAMRALNHPAGQLAQFWVKVIAADWAAAGDAWSGLPGATGEQLQSMLSTDDERAKIAEVIFAGSIHFFHGADAQWTQDHLLPLLDWANPTRASRAWEGFLTWGHPNDKLLDIGLRDQYVQAASRVAEFPDRIQPQMYRHLSAISLWSHPDRPIAEWARAITAATTETTRTSWLTQIGSDLSRLSADAVEQNWQSWLRQYWQDRIDSIPSSLTPGEAIAMTTWIWYLTSCSFTEGIALVTAASVGLPEHSDALARLTRERIEQAPTQAAHLVAHLLRHTQQPFWGGDEIRRILKDLACTEADRADLTAVREQAFRLGYADSPNW